MSPVELEELGGRITCAQAIEFILAYLEDELPAEQHEIFTAHLAICEACRNYLASYKATLRALQEAAPTAHASDDLPALPPELRAAILSSLPLKTEE